MNRITLKEEGNLNIGKKKTGNKGKRKGKSKHYVI